MSFVGIRSDIGFTFSELHFSKTRHSKLVQNSKLLTRHGSFQVVKSSEAFYDLFYDVSYQQVENALKGKIQIQRWTIIKVSTINNS